MGLKEQLIEYFSSNLSLSGNFLYFDELPEKNQIKMLNIEKNLVTVKENQLNIKENLENIEEISEEKVEKIIKKEKVQIEEKLVTVNEEFAKISKKMNENKLNIAEHDFELPDLASFRTLDELKSGISACQRCILGSTRKNFVFGEGNPNADIMVIGEAPGADEDEHGKPFVGRAGKLLTDILKAINFEREEVFIANICKCRPPANRKPTTVEIYYCEPYLKRQIDLINPKFILALGLTAAESLFKQTFKMGEIRGKLFDYHGIQTLITYHPAALLRNPSWKRPVWEDVQLLRQMYDKWKAAQ